MTGISQSNQRYQCCFRSLEAESSSGLGLGSLVLLLSLGLGNSLNCHTSHLLLVNQEEFFRRRQSPSVSCVRWRDIRGSPRLQVTDFYQKFSIRKLLMMACMTDMPS